jgi:peroxiredoxin
MAPEVRGARFIRSLIASVAGTSRVAGVVFAAISVAIGFVGPAASAETAVFAPVLGEKPGFVLRDPDGVEMTLAAHRDRSVLVHFFATWCEPCREELPALRRLVDRRGERKLDVIAISVAEVPVRVRRFIEQTPVNFPILLDEDRAVTKSWGVHALPTTFVLDARLNARLAVEREYDWDRVDVADLLEQLSREKE